MPTSSSEKGHSAPHSLEQQITKLRELGIGFQSSDEDLLKNLTEYNGAAYYEEEPYVRLLVELGYGLSPNVWTFDIECVESESTYEKYMAKMIGLAGGKIAIEDLQGKFDADAPRTEISFTYNGARHELRAENNGDWFDVDVLHQIAVIVHDKDHMFVHAWEDQQVTVIFCKRKVERDLHELMNHLLMPL